ncbi:hypothetical protein [Gelidibacter mesophilus]|uniref:hypothetical protein n=1 Tax=Gelidibacter mesophilus TaxID=169050 RepID=UPI00041D2691|nr:hypothetical protein [Gelidibacter mesophilus]
MNKLLLLIFPVLLFCYACNKKHQNIEALKSIGSTETTNIVDIKNYSPEEYKSQALAILNNAKKRLKDTLPIVINAQVELFEKTLGEIEKRAVLSLTLEETNHEIDLVRANAESVLLMDEIRVNKVFYEVVNELEILNLEYNQHYKSNPILFKDYYDVSPIILREGVLEKINELVEDEKERIKLEKKEDQMETGLMLLAIFPGGASAKNILNKIVKNARLAKHTLIASKNTNVLSNMTSKVLTKHTSKYFVEPLSNNKKRERIAQSSDRIYKSKNGALALHKTGDVINSNNTKQTVLVFKSIKNQLPGRIGDFSDGILTQPIDFLRKMINENAELISN